MMIKMIKNDKNQADKNPSFKSFCPVTQIDILYIVTFKTFLERHSGLTHVGLGLHDGVDLARLADIHHLTASVHILQESPAM